MQQNTDFKQANHEFDEFLKKYRASEYTNNFTQRKVNAYSTNQQNTSRWPFNMSPEMEKAKTYNWSIINKVLGFYFFIFFLSAIYSGIK